MRQGGKKRRGKREILRKILPQKQCKNVHETGFDHKGFGAVLNLLRFMELVLDRTSMQKHSG